MSSDLLKHAGHPDEATTCTRGLAQLEAASFSSDQKRLLFKDRLGRRVEIELASGSIQHLN